MRCRSFVLAFNAISILIFFLLLSYTMHVEGRPVPQGHSFEWEKGVTLNIRQARSGPSNRGRGHWYLRASIPVLNHLFYLLIVFFLQFFCVLLIESDIYTDSLNQTRKLYDAYAVKNAGETLSSYNMVIPSLDLFCDLDIFECNL
jgi:hypothetical protein